MSVKYYKEKHLQATKYKIENVTRQQDFLLRHRWKVIAAGIVFSFWPQLMVWGILFLIKNLCCKKRIIPI